MTDMTAERALDMNWLLSMAHHLPRELHEPLFTKVDRIRQVLSAPRVPDGWVIKQQDHGYFLVWPPSETPVSFGPAGESFAQEYLCMLCEAVLTVAQSPAEPRVPDEVSRVFAPTEMDNRESSAWAAGYNQCREHFALLNKADHSPADETCPECGQEGSHREGCPDTYLLGYKPPAGVTAPRKRVTGKRPELAAPYGDTPRITSAEQAVATPHPEDTARPDKNPCPKCGTQLELPIGGGVRCPNKTCLYWFCF